MSVRQKWANATTQQIELEIASLDADIVRHRRRTAELERLIRYGGRTPDLDKQFVFVWQANRDASRLRAELRKMLVQRAG